MLSEALLNWLFLFFLGRTISPSPEWTPVTPSRPQILQNFTSHNTPPTIYAIGDVMLSRTVGYATAKHGLKYITDAYNPGDDMTYGSLVLMNLESPFSPKDNDTRERTFIFASSPRNVEIISWLTKNKTGIVSLANNHIANAGFLGFETTIDLLKKAGIHTIGLSEWERQKFIKITMNRETFCIGAYSYDGRKYFDKNSGKTWWINSLADAKTDINAMDNADCEQKIIMLHWGREYLTSPTESQKTLAHYLVDHGADVIVGGHSHIFGDTENYKGKPIFYSLGNAIFDQNWGKNGCDAGMDCAWDETLEKNTVPTYIGTAIELPYPYDRFNKWQWNIDYGKLSKTK